MMCDCAPRTAEEAVAAAFDAFRPTRVRPYLASHDPAASPDDPADAPAGHPRPGPPPRRDQFLDQPGDGAFPSPGPAPAPAPSGRHAHTGGPKAEDVELFEDEPSTDPTTPVPAVRAAGRPRGRGSGRRHTDKRKVAAVVVVAAALSLGIVAFASGSDGTGQGDEGALPVPSGAAPGTTEPDTASGPASPSASSSGRSPSASSAPSSASGSPTSERSKRAKASNEPTRAEGDLTERPAPSASPSESGDPDGGSDGGSSGGSEGPQSPSAGSPVLRQGDSGSGVLELQQRLKQIPFVYVLGDEDGVYDEAVTRAVRDYQRSRDVSGDPSGVYGPNTRRALESETSA
ncbi:hypothetical protein AQ490_11975 [Wenjunlia vitaminophila]|uniref:Peptidoglycan binding-like domain-containing protein n=2 Tax=Wenjunlia vitaminophila TaxID=76728 RepID=A0A0T6LKG0_WENVI|nr:hypothetical protein AQ490_11975 [Wenjunlia vitaminophila]